MQISAIPFGAVRVRVVEYSAAHTADPWCVNRHVLPCLEGELHTELEDGRSFVLKAGMRYPVANSAEPIVKLQKSYASS